MIPSSHPEAQKDRIAQLIEAGEENRAIAAIATTEFPLHPVSPDYVARRRGVFYYGRSAAGPKSVSGWGKKGRKPRPDLVRARELWQTMSLAKVAKRMRCPYWKLRKLLQKEVGA